MKKPDGAGETTRWHRRWLPLLGLVATAALLTRVAVAGESMVPTLQPGDRLLVLRFGHRLRLKPGDLVTVRDPRDPRAGPVLVKRIGDVEGSTVMVTGDNANASTDSRSFGRVPRSLVEGKVLYRYGPSARAGIIH